ncbi:MAG TPA: bifunctional phosphopantothenoylcysteine decarboxylase/phosphopantothenate--cysteine ligase CoaBC [Candidatus Nanoarchaeia archaeon]|nr:bifunctional phosphopantothenoylcysteine decarboxylase/phosphopantothenate--cysteine ligase CoaBC [Candidatus Nanoarchaeia archaeon]
MKTVVIGVTSSIACYKAAFLIKKLKGFNIEVILTHNALNLIDKKEFEKVLGKKVHIDMFYPGWNYKDYIKRAEMEHISLADKADLFLICPATANFIGKVANGIADDLLTTSVMATAAPVLICPAMNCKMWENRIVQGNVRKLAANGYYLVMPEKGKLACGYEGEGRLASLDVIEKEVRHIIENKDKLKGKRIIVTAGGTSEEIDPVRVITNKSSGKMGIYIAEEAAKMGASVTLIRGRTEVEPFGNMKDIKVRSVSEMEKAIRKELRDNDLIIHAAAVSDFTVEKTKGKISSGKGIVLTLKPTAKLIDSFKKANKKIKVIGFKAEHDVDKATLLSSAKKLLKSADLVVANDVSKGVFGSEENDVYVVGKDKVEHIIGSKREIARILLLAI